MTAAFFFIEIVKIKVFTLSANQKVKFVWDITKNCKFFWNENHKGLQPISYEKV